MARLTQNQAERLLDDGVLSQKSYKELQERGMIAEGKRQQRLTIMHTESGKKVNPTLVFRGGQGQEDSEKMKALRNEFWKLVNKYDETNLNQSNKGESKNE
jgi:hypothetical protein